MGRRSRVLGLLSGGLLLAPSGGAAASGPPADAYAAEIAAHRAEREAGLRAEYGWLSLVGLVWLERGPNTFGSDPASAIVLPGEAVLAQAGRLVYDGTTVTLEPAPNSGLEVNGEPATARVLRDDGDDEVDVMQLGRVRFQIIERGERHGVRVRDPESPVRTGFHGLEYFPADLRWRVKAVLRPFEKPREVSIQDVLGSTSTQYAPGLLEFEIDGQPLSLVPLVGEPGETELFIMFRDETTGKETYGAGRYLAATLEGTSAVLDFNRAYNPPCAFTEYATCPLPPRENRMGVRIAAGERKYGDH